MNPIKCIGKNKDGTPCNNEAGAGNLYCHLHQDQITQEDINQKRKTSNTAGIILLLLFLVGFLIASSGGCEEQFLDWASQ